MIVNEALHRNEITYEIEGTYEDKQDKLNA